MTNELITLKDGQAVTDTYTISVGVNYPHKNVIALCRKHVESLKKFGRVEFIIQPFETTGGTQRREVALLNEDQALLLMSLMQNNETVVAFKVRLIQAFRNCRDELTKVKAAPAVQSTPASPVDQTVSGILCVATYISQKHGVPQGRATAHALAEIEENTGINMEKMRALIPATPTEEVRMFNPTYIGKQLSPQKSAVAVNNLLAGLGYQKKVNGEWQLTEKAEGFGENRPFENHGHSGFQIQWGENIIEVLQAALDSEPKQGELV